MSVDKLIENIMEQIKEAQIKLGFAKECIRLYYPVDSLCRLLQVENRNGEELLDALEKEKGFGNTKLGGIRFSMSKDRVEVCIPPEGAAYIHEQMPNPPFLTVFIQLFKENHNPSIEDISKVFASFSGSYVCERMEPGQDFDYVLYFPDKKPDAWFYCIREEMGHTIYHRFTEDDYRNGIW